MNHHIDGLLLRTEPAALLLWAESTALLLLLLLSLPLSLLPLRCVRFVFADTPTCASAPLSHPCCDGVPLRN